jgi:hypothetical protein
MRVGEGALTTAATTRRDELQLATPPATDNNRAAANKAAWSRGRLRDPSCSLSVSCCPDDWAPPWLQAWPRHYAWHGGSEVTPAGSTHHNRNEYPEHLRPARDDDPAVRRPAGRINTATEATSTTSEAHARRCRSGRQKRSPRSHHLLERSQVSPVSCEGPHPGSGNRGATHDPLTRRAQTIPGAHPRAQRAP